MTQKTLAELTADFADHARYTDYKNLLESVALLTGPAENILNVGRVAKYTYDFTVNGGAVGTIPMSGVALPVRAIVVAGLAEVITTPVGATATIAVTSGEAANDIITAAAISGAPWSTAGRKAIIPLWSDMTKAIKTTVATRIPAAVVGTAALTAGKFDLWLVYVVADGA